ncbi:MAG: hypothetical protein R6X17_15435 [Candidatus Competibacteraceae bacterium]
MRRIHQQTSKVDALRLSTLPLTNRVVRVMGESNAELNLRAQPSAPVANACERKKYEENHGQSK